MPSNQKWACFALIELLVTVAIIAVLLALLMPALGRALVSARRVACLSNLKQMGEALYAYIADNGVMPGYMEPSSGLSGIGAWVKNVSDWPRAYGGASPLHGDYYAYLHDLLLMGGNPAADDIPNAAHPNPRKLNFYIDNAAELFRCPADRGAVNISPVMAEDMIPVYDRPALLSATGHQAPGSSYLYNACPGWTGPARTLSFKASVRDPSRLIALGDYTFLYTWLTDEAPYPMYRPDRCSLYNWHDPPQYHLSAEPDPIGLALTGRIILDYDPQGNVVFCDGHAESVLFEKSFMTREYIVYDMNEYGP